MFIVADLVSLRVNGKLQEQRLWSDWVGFQADPTLHWTYLSISLALPYCYLYFLPDNLCKQFGPRSGPTKCWVWSGSKLFETNSILKMFFEKVDFLNKIYGQQKKHAKFPIMQGANPSKPSILIMGHRQTVWAQIRCCRIETVLLSTHNIGFGWEIRKLNFRYTLY